MEESLAAKLEAIAAAAVDVAEGVDDYNQAIGGRARRFLDPQLVASMIFPLARRARTLGELLARRAESETHDEDLPEFVRALARVDDFHVFYEGLPDAIYGSFAQPRQIYNGLRRVESSWRLACESLGFAMTGNFALQFSFPAYLTMEQYPAVPPAATADLRSAAAWIVQGIGHAARSADARRDARRYVPDEVDAAILAVLAKQSFAVSQQAIVDALGQSDAQRDLRTVQGRLAKLRAAGLVVYPGGSKRGTIITDAGRAVLPKPPG